MSESSSNILKQVFSLIIRTIVNAWQPLYESKPIYNLHEDFYFHLKGDHVPEQQNIQMEQIIELGFKIKHPVKSMWCIIMIVQERIWA